MLKHRLVLVLFADALAGSQQQTRKGEAGGVSAYDFLPSPFGEVRIRLPPLTFIGEPLKGAF